jgi:hypothetical protein
MKKSKFSESQIFNILKQAESGVAVVDMCREYGINTAAFYKMKWGCITDSGHIPHWAIKRLGNLWLVVLSVYF